MSRKMKTVLVAVTLLVCLTGCRKKIDGYECKSYGLSYQPVRNFCPSCEDYCLASYCEDCGTKQPDTYIRDYCPSCKQFVWGRPFCGECGGKTMFKERER